MTITLAAVTVDDDRLERYGCVAEIHDTDRAYRVHRCRCPEAIRTHSARRGKDKPRTVPTCQTRRHQTVGSYLAGCVCPESAAKWAALEDQATREARLARQAAVAEIDREYQRWHGPDAHVSTVSLMLLSARLPNARAFWDEASTRERQLAIVRLGRRRSATQDRPATYEEIAEWLGLSTGESVLRYRREFHALVGQRTRRRLAAARWRAAHKHAGDRAG